MLSNATKKVRSHEQIICADLQPEVDASLNITVGK